MQRKIAVWVLVLGLLMPGVSQGAWVTYINGPEPDNPKDALTAVCGKYDYTPHWDTLRPLYLYSKMVGYSVLCVLESDPLFRTTGLTYPRCNSDTQNRDARASTGCVPKSEPKNNGAQCPSAGNPFTVATGNKFQIVTDYTSSGTDQFVFQRAYNSVENLTAPLGNPIGVNRTSMMGTNWRSNWDRSVLVLDTNWIYIRRTDAVEFQFKKISGNWVSQSGKDVGLRVTDSNGELKVTDLDDTVETYDYSGNDAGKLLQVRKKNGYTQTVSYDASNKIQTVTDSYGRTFGFVYTTYTQSNVTPVLTESLLTELTLPDGGKINFEYGNFTADSAFPHKLIAAKYPDATPNDPNDNPKIVYAYEDANFPQAMTGIIDEKNNRLATWTYDSLGRVQQSTHAGGAENTTVAYNDANTRTVTNALGKQTIYHYTTVQEAPKITQVEGVANGTCEAANQNYTYDTNGYPLTRTDWKGNVTKFVYNSSGLQTSRTEAFGTALARTITTTWHSTFRVPTQIVAPGKTTDFTYDGNGWLQTKTETDTTSNAVPYSTNGQQRVWTYTYTAGGLVHTVNGPRGDVSDITTYDYDAAGNLNRVTNALNQETNVTQFDANGLPLTVVDANNVSTTLTYDERQRLKTVSTGGATTQFDYEPTSNISRITLPNGAYFNYEYDNAQRLTAIANNNGERVEFTLDAMGNRTATKIKNGGGTILYTHSQTFDALGRLLTDIGAANQTATFGYDKNDNQTSILNGRQFTTSWAFDALDRLYQMTDALTHATGFANNAQDLQTGVTDPRNVATTYVYNGFGEAIYESSPDSGNIKFYRDAAGNITQRVDARNVITNYTYDALNRVLTETYPGNTDENRTYLYDNATAGAYGIGRFHKFTDDSGSTTYTYDARGNVVKNVHVIKGHSYTTQYEYDLANQLTKLTYPSGRIVNYTRDSLGRVSSITTKASAAANPVNIATSITYNPFGEVTGWTYGNGAIGYITYDTDYRITNVRVMNGAINLFNTDYAYDANNNVQTTTDNATAARSQSFVYDALDRLTQAIGIYGTETYGYDFSSNRTGKTSAGVSVVYTYPNGSNRLQTITQGGNTIRSFTYDAAGNVVADNTANTTSLVYNNAGRYSQFTKNLGEATVNYKYNALGERVLKEELQQEFMDMLNMAMNMNLLEGDGGGETEIPATHTHYHYDLDQNLIAENKQGLVDKEYIYLPINASLSDDISITAATALPIAHLNNTGGTATNEILYIIADNQRTPQKMMDGTKAIVWDRTQTPFGEEVTLAGTKATNLRLPGQYFDAESGYHYNLMRDYASGLGRYLQSDPIGLDGGINRFGYVDGNPLNNIDPKGTNAIVSTGIMGAIELCAMSPACSGAVAAGLIYLTGKNDSSKNSPKDQNKSCEPSSTQPPDDNCDYQYYEVDIPMCRGISRKFGKAAAARCYASAAERYGNCIAGRPIGPLDTWRN